MDFLTVGLRLVDFREGLVEEGDFVGVLGSGGAADLAAADLRDWTLALDLDRKVLGREATGMTAGRFLDFLGATTLRRETISGQK
jgi:hypothetical protein